MKRWSKDYEESILTKMNPYNSLSKAD